MQATLHSVVEDIQSLPFDDKFVLQELIQKMTLEARQEDMLTGVLASEKSYDEGKVKEGSVKDFLNDLRN